MANQGNRPGQSARKIKDQTYQKRVHVILVGIFGVTLCIIFLFVGMKTGIGAFIVIVVIMKLIMSKVDAREGTYIRKEKRAERGARAEETIENVLGNLKGEYELFHDVVKEYGDIDHIVLSREYGLFVIETKSHHGEITVVDGTPLINGKQLEKDFIAQALRNTMWLKNRVKETTGLVPWIQPIIVFTNGFVREWKPVKGVLLRNKKYLVKCIEETHTNNALAKRLWDMHEGGSSLW